MIKQSEALRLADELVALHGYPLSIKAAEELRRLDAIEQEWAALSQDDGKAEREIERLRAENQRMASELARPMTSEATLVLHDNTRLRAINKQLLTVLQELDEASDYWSEYFVPIGIFQRMRAAIAAAKETQ